MVVEIQFQHKFVNLSSIIANIKNALTNLYMNCRLKIGFDICNAALNTFCEAEPHLCLASSRRFEVTRPDVHFPGL